MFVSSLDLGMAVCRPFPICGGEFLSVKITIMLSCFVTCSYSYSPLWDVAAATTTECAIEHNGGRMKSSVSEAFSRKLHSYARGATGCSC